MGVRKIRFTGNCGIGIKPISQEAPAPGALALQYAVDNTTVQ